MSKKKLAILGAALFQEPAIIKAQEMGYETHVFAWAAGDMGEKMADHFYPISIKEQDEILEKCKEIGIDGKKDFSDRRTDFLWRFPLGL